MRVAEEFDPDMARMIDVVGHEVGHAGVLGIRPDRVDRIEFQRLDWQPFDVQPTRTRLTQLADGRTTEVQPIYDHDQWLTRIAILLSQINDRMCHADVLSVNRERHADSTSSRQQAEAVDDAQSGGTGKVARRGRNSRDRLSGFMPRAGPIARNPRTSRRGARRPADYLSFPQRCTHRRKRRSFSHQP